MLCGGLGKKVVSLNKPKNMIIALTIYLLSHSDASVKLRNVLAMLLALLEDIMIIRLLFYLAT